MSRLSSSRMFVKAETGKTVFGKMGTRRVFRHQLTRTKKEAAEIFRIAEDNGARIFNLNVGYHQILPGGWHRYPTA